MINNIYDWKEIENILKEELSKTTAIKIFGTIGSLNINHDIDIIIAKDPKEKSSVFYKEIHGILDKVDSYLKKNYNQKAIRFSEFNAEDEVLKLGKYTKGDLALHVMAYVSYEQMKQDWESDIPADMKLDDILNTLKPLKGSVTDLYSAEFEKRNKYDNLHLRINHNDRTHSNYEEKLYIEKMNNIYKYINKQLGKEYAPARNFIETKNKFYEIADIIDEANK